MRRGWGSPPADALAELPGRLRGRGQSRL